MDVQSLRGNPASMVAQYNRPSLDRGAFPPVRARVIQGFQEAHLMHLADFLEDERTRNFWTYFPNIPVGSIFSFGGPTHYKKTGDATYREHCTYDRSERVYALKDLGKLLRVVRLGQR